MPEEINQAIRQGLSLQVVIRGPELLADGGLNLLADVGLLCGGRACAVLCGRFTVTGLSSMMPRRLLLSS